MEVAVIGWWRLDGSGVDSSPSHDDLTVANATSVGGQVGGGFTFTPGTSCIHGLAPAGASLSGAPGFTMMAWVRVSEDFQCPGLDQGTFVFGKGNDYNLAIKCFADGTPTLFPLVSQGGGLGWGDARAGAFSRGAWPHLAATWDRSTVTIFVDGQLTWTIPAPHDVNNDDQDVSIGCVDSHTYWVGQNFDGQIDEAILYDRPLSPTQIEAYYTASASPAQCSFAPKPDGTTCSDGNACTAGETCQSGACVGGLYRGCSARPTTPDAP
jgi:hypothetical protein